VYDDFKTILQVLYQNRANKNFLAISTVDHVYTTWLCGGSSNSSGISSDSGSSSILVIVVVVVKNSIYKLKEFMA
jgi:hypothetical protein